MIPNLQLSGSELLNGTGLGSFLPNDLSGPGGTEQRPDPVSHWPLAG